MIPFNWTEPYGLADRQHHCHWEGLHLWADMFGSWTVNLHVDDSVPARVLVSDLDQVQGSDLQDAMRSAQAAPIVLHQLSTNR